MSVRHHHTCAAPARMARFRARLPSRRGRHGHGLTKEARMPFYEKGKVRIHYEEAGSGFPLMIIAGGGLNSVLNYRNAPFDPIAQFKGEYRCIAADLRNANDGQS